MAKEIGGEALGRFYAEENASEKDVNGVDSKTHFMITPDGFIL